MEDGSKADIRNFIEGVRSPTCLIRSDSAELTEITMAYRVFQSARRQETFAGQCSLTAADVPAFSDRTIISHNRQEDPIGRRDSRSADRALAEAWAAHTCSACLNGCTES